MSKVRPFKNGPLPPWGVHPRYMEASSATELLASVAASEDEKSKIETWCPLCVWCGPQNEYRRHREEAHSR